MRRSSAVVSIIVLLAACTGIFADGLPTWPQQFELPQGRTAVFTVPITQPGDVVVEVTWTGSAPTVAVKDLSGNAVSAARQQLASGVKLSFAVSQADAQKNILWFVSIAAPGAVQVNAGTKPVTKGQINVTGPPADAKRVEALMSQLRQKAKETSIQVKAELRKRVQSDAKLRAGKTGKTLSNNPAAENAMLAQVKASIDRANKLKAQQSQVILSKIRTEPTSIIRPTGPRIDNRIPDNIRPLRELGPPSIASVTPNHGASGDEVTLSVDNLAPSDVVRLRLYDNTEMWPAEKSRTDKSVTVVIPQYISPNNMYSMFYLTGERSSGAVYSNGKDFTLDATIPEITSVSPGGGTAGDTVLIKGSGLNDVRSVKFRPYNAQVAKFFPTQNTPSLEVSFPIVAQSDTDLMARVPWTLDGLAANVDGYFWVEVGSKNTSFPYQSARFQLRPTIITKPLYEPYSRTLTIFQTGDQWDRFAQVWTAADDAQNPNDQRQWIEAEHFDNTFRVIDYDTYYMDVRLKNGWVMDHAEVLSWPVTGPWAHLDSALTGPNGEPGARVTWSVSYPQVPTEYYLWIYARGPKGVPYK